MRSKKYKKSKNIFDVDDEIDYSLWGGRNPYEIALKSVNSAGKREELSGVFADGLREGFKLKKIMVLGEDNLPLINTDHISDVWKSNDSKIIDPFKIASYEVYVKNLNDNMMHKENKLLSEIFRANDSLTNAKKLKDDLSITLSNETDILEIDKIQKEIDKREISISNMEKHISTFNKKITDNVEKHKLKSFDEYTLANDNHAISRINTYNKRKPPAIITNNSTLFNREAYHSLMDDNLDPMQYVIELSSKDAIPRSALNKDVINFNDLMLPKSQQKNRLNNLLKQKGLELGVPDNKYITSQIEYKPDKRLNEIDELKEAAETLTSTPAKKTTRKAADTNYPAPTKVKPVKKRKIDETVKKSLFNENDDLLPPDNNEVELWIQNTINDAYEKDQDNINNISDFNTKNIHQIKLDNQKKETIENLTNKYKDDNKKFLKNNKIEKRSNLITNSQHIKLLTKITKLKDNADEEIKRLSKLKDNADNKRKINIQERKKDKYDNLLLQKPTVAIYNRYMNMNMGK
jgi:hypothetical protein